MTPITLTNAQARRFLLRHHGLLGPHTFVGKEGALNFVRQSGCIQYDPIDVCGKNAELVLQSRVKGFSKGMLDELLYQDRLLVDYFDKQLAIIPVENWPHFARDRAYHRQQGRSYEAVERAAETVLAALAAREYIASGDLPALDEKVHWYWSETRLSRATLESLYFRGDLCIHHKQGALKHYAPAQRLLPSDVYHAPDPFQTAEDYRDWKTLRRVGAVGLLWNRASDAFLGVDGLKQGGRAAAFANLLAQDALVEVRVEGIAEPLYTRQRELPLLEAVRDDASPPPPRMEFIAPLDTLLWDRKLIRTLFDFSYTWEIYTPAAKRQYGYYVLPILRGDRFVGRVEAVCDRKRRTLTVPNVWWEGRAYTADLRKCLRRFARFHGYTDMEGPACPE